MCDKLTLSKNIENTNNIFKDSDEYNEVLTVNYYTAYNINIKLKELGDFNINIHIESLGDSNKNMYWEDHFNNLLDYFEDINKDFVSINIPIINKQSKQLRIQFINKSNSNKNMKIVSIIEEVSLNIQRLYNLSISNKLLFKDHSNLLEKEEPMYQIIKRFKKRTKYIRLPGNPFECIMSRERKDNFVSSTVPKKEKNDTSLYNFKRRLESFYLNFKSKNQITFKTSFKANKDKFYICSISGFSKEIHSKSFLYVGSKDKYHYSQSFDYMLNRSLGHLSLIFRGDDMKDDNNNIEFGIIQQKNSENEEEIHISKMFYSEVNIDDCNYGFPIICPRKKYDLAIVIAMHERNWMVEKNVNILNKCGLNICIILISSLDGDYGFCKKLSKKHKNVYYYKTKNNFIGCKWQIGFLYAKLLNPNYVIITGSDDILLPSFINTIYNECVNNDYDLCGVRNWSIYHEQSGLLYDFNYTSAFGSNELLLGAGRIYSSRILNRFNWNVHEHTKDKYLDSLGFYMCKMHNAKIGCLNIPGLISYKGNWECMNDFKKLIKVSKRSNGSVKLKYNKDKLQIDMLKNLINS